MFYTHTRHELYIHTHTHCVGHVSVYSCDCTLMLLVRWEHIESSHQRLFLRSVMLLFTWIQLPRRMLWSSQPFGWPASVRLLPDCTSCPFEQQICSLWKHHVQFLAVLNKWWQILDSVGHVVKRNNRTFWWKHTLNDLEFTTLKVAGEQHIDSCQLQKCGLIKVFNNNNNNN